MVLRGRQFFSRPKFQQQWRMKKLFSKKTLPILVSIQATDSIQKIKLLPHPEGFACEIQGAPIEELVNEIFEFLECYLSKKHLPFSRLSWGKSLPFTQKVLNTLPTIPFGKTISYRQIAEVIGSPLAARAVGQACGRNPFPLFFPCHRVISSNSTLGGFSEGLRIKKSLLQFEGHYF